MALTVEDAIELLSRLEPYYVILIATVGLFGNSISFMLFAFTKLRLKEVHIILAVLAVVDNGFLLVLLVVTLKHFNIDLVNNYEMGCKLSVFLPYLFGFLSIWLIVLFSIERFIVVYFPLKRHDLCSPSRNKKSILMLLVISVAFYSYGFWTSSIKATIFTDNNKSPSLNSTRSICVTADEWLSLLKIMAIFDTVLTMFIPFIFILTLNILIIVKLTRSNSLRRSSSAYLQSYNFIGNSRHSSSAYQASALGFNSTLKRDRLSLQTFCFNGGTNRKANRLSTARESNSLLGLNTHLRLQKSGENQVRAGSKQDDKEQNKDKDQNEVHEKRLNSENMNNSPIIKSLYPERNSLSVNPTKIKKFSILSTSSSFSRRDRRLSSPCDDSIACHSTHRSSNRYSKTTRTLLIISTAFLMLHGPTAALKIWYILPFLANSDPKTSSTTSKMTLDTTTYSDSNFSTEGSKFAFPHENSKRFQNVQDLIEPRHAHYGSDKQATINTFDHYPVEELLERITCYVYYLHYSLNFFLYVLNMKKFRRICIKYFRKRN